MSSDITYYWVSGSTVCWQPMICLEEKGLSGYNSRRLSWDKKEHKSEEVLNINPRGQVPSFKHGDVVVNESLAICLYLESAFKGQGTKLLPDNPAKQALVFQMMMEAGDLLNTADVVVHDMWHLTPEERDEVFLAEKRKALVEKALIWEHYLAQNEEGPYITGKDFTMADACLFPVLAAGLHYQMPSKGRFPRLLNYYELVKERPSVKASWPPHWKANEKPPASLALLTEV